MGSLSLEEKNSHDHPLAAKMPPPIALFDGKGGGVMTKFMELERKVKQMHADGQDPMGITNWINSQLLPMANVSKTELQGEVNRAQQAVDGCATSLAQAEDSAREQETTLSIGESRHNECTLLEAQRQKTSEDDCQGVQSIVNTIAAPVDMGTVDLNSTDAVEDALQHLYRFFEQQYPAFMDEDQHCTQSTNLAEQQAQQCQADQAGIEASYCSLRSARQQICSDYDACYQEKTALLTRVIDDVRQVEEHVKNTFKTLTCFGRTVMQDMPNSRPACNASEVDTTYLNVFYPSEPTRESCSDSVSTSWNYSANLCDEQEGGDVEEGGGEGEGEVVEANNTPSGNESLVAAGITSGGNLIKNNKTVANQTAQKSNSISTNPHR
jgi:hypothetical protein